MKEDILKFRECDTCKAKPGMPTLCEGCLHNRHALFLLGRFLDAVKKDFEILCPAPVEPHWEVVPAREKPECEPVGYQVRWSEPDEEGRYYWVGHYYEGEGASLQWCKHAAERHAARWNEEHRAPWMLKAFQKP